MISRAQFALLAAGFLAACAGEESPLGGTPEIAKACAVRACECLDENVPFFFIRKRAPVEWRENGDAFCPAGFILVLRDEK